MNKKNQEQLLVKLLQNDRIGKPDQMIEDRLMYSFLLKNSQSKMKQNSFANFFSWIFSIQGLGLKTGLVSIVLFVSILNNHYTFDSSKISNIDSITTQKILLADSTHFIQNVDSIKKETLY